VSLRSRAQSGMWWPMGFCVLNQRWVIATKNSRVKQSTFDEGGLSRAHLSLDLHRIFMEPQ
jgi:hypothetical protein